MGVCGLGSQGITRVGQAVLAKLIETQIWHPLCLSAMMVRVRLNKRIMAPAYFFAGTKAISPALTLKLLPQCWSSVLVSWSVSLGRLCKGMPKTIAALPHVIRADVHSQMIWGLFFLALVLWVKEPGVGLGPPLLRVHLCS